MKTKPQHSHYWVDKDLFIDDDSVDIEDKHSENITKIIRLSAVRRAIGNFVSILCGENVPVNFSNCKDSYTDGKHVTIAGDTNPNNFDVMVGLALHEGSHVLMTDFSFLRSVVAPVINNPYTRNFAVPNSQRYISSAGRNVCISQRYISSAVIQAGVEFLHPDIAAAIQTDNNYSTNLGQVYADIKTIMNVLEDRRIDAHIYKTAKGYRPYYKALYEKYFLNRDVLQNLKHNPDWRNPTVENYINQLILSIHPDFDPQVMPGLVNLVNMMGLNNIDRVAPENDPRDANGTPRWHNTLAFNATPILWQEANRIYAEILKWVALPANSPNSPTPNNSAANSASATGEGGEGEGGEGSGSEDGESAGEGSTGGGDGSTEVDPVQPTAPTGKYNPKAGARAIDNLNKLVNGEVKKKTVTQGQMITLNSMEKSGANIETATVDGYPAVETLVVRKMTLDLLEQPWFPLDKSWRGDVYDDYIAAGRRMGAVMVNRLQIRNDPLYTKNTRLNQGKIDRRLLANLGMEIDSVFFKDRVDAHRPAMLHLSIDASGSMRGAAWGQALTVAVAVAHVANKLPNVDAVISLRAGGDKLPVTIIAFDSRKDNFNSFVNAIKWVEVTSATPEGLCFDAVQKIVLDSKDTHDIYFINFSDGMPAFQTKAGDTYVNYCGEVAYNHTRRMINKFRESGVKVLSYYIESEMYSASAQSAFKQMYGEDASFIDVSNVTQVLGTLNRRLAVR